MDGKNIFVLVILAALGYLLYTHFSSVSSNVSTAVGNLNLPISWLEPTNSQGGGAGDTSQQTAMSFAGMPAADYSQGPTFYVQNQPWYLGIPQGNVMPMTSGSVNITGGPSAQNNAVVGLTSTWY